MKQIFIQLEYELQPQLVKKNRSGNELQSINQIINNHRNKYRQYTFNGIIQILLKELREIFVTFDLASFPFLFQPPSMSILSVKNSLSPITILLRIQHMAQTTWNENTSIMIHEILLNLSASPQCTISVQDLDLTELTGISNRYNVISLLVQILGNLLLKDKSCRVLYGLVNMKKNYLQIQKQRKITSQKSIEVDLQWRQPSCENLQEKPFMNNIFCILLQLIERKQSFLKIKAFQNSFLWFTTHCLAKTKQFQYVPYCEKDYTRMKMFVMQLITNRLENILDQFMANKRDNSYELNQFFIYLRFMLKCKAQISQHLLLKICNEAVFEASIENIFYLKLINSLLFQTSYTLPKHSIKLLTKQIINYGLKQPNNRSNTYANHILIILSNNLQNPQVDLSSTVILKQLTDYHNFPQSVFRQQYPNTFIIVELLNNQAIRQNVQKLLGNIIMSQGQLGVLRQCLADIVKSVEGYKMITGMGFEFQ